ncbi:MAG: hypothetical protein U0519_01540 [Candidatus Gracilibacteria bacterium]
MVSPLPTLPGVVHRPGKTVENNLGVSCFFQHIQGIVPGIAHVNNDRKVKLQGKPQLFAKGMDLNFTWLKISKIVQSHLSKCNDFLFGTNRRSKTLPNIIVPFIGIMGMNPKSRPKLELMVFFNKIQSLEGILNSTANNDLPADTGMACPG